MDHKIWKHHAKQTTKWNRPKHRLEKPVSPAPPRPAYLLTRFHWLSFDIPDVFQSNKQSRIKSSPKNDSGQSERAVPTVIGRSCIYSNVHTRESTYPIGIEIASLFSWPLSRHLEVPAEFQKLCEGCLRIIFMAWRCSFCGIFSTLLVHFLLTHINTRHSEDVHFQAICGIDGCAMEFKKANSFVRHVRTNHRLHLYDDFTCAQDFKSGKYRSEMFEIPNFNHSSSVYY